MQKRFRVRWLVNLALLVIVGLLIGIALLDRPGPIEATKRLADFLPDAINEIRIQRPGKNDIHFKLVGSYWNMLAPYQTRAEDSLIKQILSVSTLEVSASIDNRDIDRSNFGLQSPVVTIQLNQHHLNFGDSQAINSRRYIELDSKIMLVPDRHVSQFKAGSVSYIDRHLIPQGTQVTDLRINEKQVELDKPDTIGSNWLETKASWISLAPATQARQGTDIYLQLDNTQTIHYVAENRESDFILLNPQQMLEYHLPFSAAQSLGLPLPESSKTLETPHTNNQ